MSHLFSDTSRISPPSIQDSALLDGGLSHSRNSSPAQAPDGLIAENTNISRLVEHASCVDCDDSDDNNLTKTPHNKTSPISLSSAEGIDLTSCLEPTYIGHVPTTEDAHVLLKACLSGPLRMLPRGPRLHEWPILVRSGSIFIYEQSASGIRDWNDGTCWSPMYQDDGFWASCQTYGKNGLMKKTLSIPTRGGLYHLVCYYNPWETVDGTLGTPSQDLKLRGTTIGTALAFWHTQSIFRKEQLFFYSELAEHSPSLHEILQHLSVDDSKAVQTTMALYQQQFPSFRNAKNHEILCFVICYTTSTSRRTTEMLHEWVKLEEGFTTYHQLLAYLQGSSAFHELVLSLAALLLVYCINQEDQSTVSIPRASLADLDRFLNGHFAIRDSHSFLSTMLWTFLWRLTSEVESNALIQLLGCVAIIPNPLPQVVNSIPAIYWKYRASDNMTHKMAMAQLQKRVEPVYSPISDEPLVEDGKKKQDSQTCWKDFFCLPGTCCVGACVPQREKSWFSMILEAFQMGEVGWGN